MTPLSFMKAVSASKEDRSFWGRARTLWWSVKLWWSDEVWRCYAPRWMTYSWWRWTRFYHAQISSRLFPRQRWLTRQVPRGWIDKTNLIPLVLYACVIDFVESEDCFNVTGWTNSGLAEEEKQLRAVYAWAKTGRAAFLKRIDEAYPELPLRPKGESFEEWFVGAMSIDNSAAYGEVHRLEAEFAAEDARQMKVIIDLLPTLWV